MFKKILSAFLSVTLIFVSNIPVLAVDEDIEEINDTTTESETLKETDLNKVDKIIIKAGTVVPVILDEPATSKKLKTGSKIEGAVYSNLLVDDVMVFKEGGRAFLNVKFAKKAAFLGIPGELTVKDGEIFDINGQRYKVNLDEVLKGKAKLYPKILAGISIFFLWPLALFLFVKGEQAELPAHTPIDTVIPKDTVFVPVL